MNAMIEIRIAGVKDAAELAEIYNQGLMSGLQLLTRIMSLQKK